MNKLRQPLDLESDLALALRLLRDPTHRMLMLPLVRLHKASVARRWPAMRRVFHHYTGAEWEAAAAELEAVAEVWRSC